jgi:hypothetical protein
MVADKDLLLGTGVRSTASLDILWEGIPECSEKKCVLFSRCLFPKVGECGFRRCYLQGVEHMLIVAYGKDKLAQLKIGTEVIPLYSQLFTAKLKMIKEDSDANSKRVREVIRSIEAVLRTIPRSGYIGVKTSPGSDEEDYYGKMETAGIIPDKSLKKANTGNRPVGSDIFRRRRAVVRGGSVARLRDGGKFKCSPE